MMNNHLFTFLYKFLKSDCSPSLGIPFRWTLMKDWEILWKKREREWWEKDPQHRAGRVQTVEVRKSLESAKTARPLGQVRERWDSVDDKLSPFSKASAMGVQLWSPGHLLPQSVIMQPLHACSWRQQLLERIIFLTTKHSFQHFLWLTSWLVLSTSWACSQAMPTTSQLRMF